MRHRFGVDVSKIDCCDRDATILRRAERLRKNYKKYTKKLPFVPDDIAMFDFVAKGTTQMYLHKILERHIKGFYFLQLEPEFMADKGLDIDAFYTEQEREDSAIYENYYVLETVLTSPYSQVLEFDSEGRPVYADETRKDSDIRCLNRMHEGIEGYFDECVSLVPDVMRNENKGLDEAMLCVMNHVEVKDEEFMSMIVEDPFFGRMTEIGDVLG